MSLEALKSIDGLDINAGLNNCMDDEELYLQVVEMFVQQIDDDIANIKQLHANSDFIGLGKACHGVKGAAASIGAVKVQNLASELEVSGKNEDSASIGQNYKDFVDTLLACQAELKQAL
jgi:HPt (histidine-containing phosphotransfer) domain-containing protein